jgi:DNA mismatch repair protein PMS2
MSSSEIRPIEAESVRRIVAGQAVTDLASAVKELVDNALDAGSKSINSKLKVLRSCGSKSNCVLVTFF